MTQPAPNNLLKQPVTPSLAVTLLTNFINMLRKVPSSHYFLKYRMITLQASQQPFICQVCRRDYDRNVAIPVIVCKNFHVICHNCLQSLAIQSDSFPCPYCRMTCGWRRTIQFKFLLDVKDKLVKMVRQQEQLRSRILQLQAKNTVLSIEAHQLLLRLSMQDVQYRLNQSSRWAWGTTQQQHYRNLERRLTELEGWRIYFKEQANNHANINQNLLRQLKNKNQRIANLQISLSSLQQQCSKKIQSIDNDKKAAIRSIRHQYYQRAKKLQRLAEQASAGENIVQLAGLIYPELNEQSQPQENVTGAGVCKNSINDSQM